MSNNKKISNERKTIYQIGIVLTIIGFLLIISVFITFAMNFGNFENFDSRAKSDMFRFGGGMLLIIIGKICQSLGRLGIAGSGFILDTEKERKDLEPISRMLGGQLNDALEETNLKTHLGQNQVIKIKCQSCNHLNDEVDKFCGGCGKKI